MSILKLPAQKTGRDFVCGDIHGSFSCVQRFLKEINFEPARDRFICAGDLIDRGPDNESCLRLLLEPWFFCTRGNHEQLMLDYFLSRRGSSTWRSCGGLWGLGYRDSVTEASREITDIIQNRVSTLPLLITVAASDGSTAFHVLHAEINALGRVLSDTMLGDWSKFSNLALRHTLDGPSIMWSRRIFKELAFRELSPHLLDEFTEWANTTGAGVQFGPQLSRIYSGHTVVRRPVNFCGQVNLDTGAFGSYHASAAVWCGLSVCEPATDSYWFINDREFKAVRPVTISKGASGQLQHDLRSQIC